MQSIATETALPTSMDALVLLGPNEFEVQSVPVPVPGRHARVPSLPRPRMGHHGVRAKWAQRWEFGTRGSDRLAGRETVDE